MDARVAALDRRDRRPRCWPAISLSSCLDSASSTGLAPDTARLNPCPLTVGKEEASPTANARVTCACARTGRDVDPRPRKAGGGRRREAVDAIERVEAGRPVLLGQSSRLIAVFSSFNDSVCDVCCCCRVRETGTSLSHWVANLRDLLTMTSLHY